MALFKRKSASADFNSSVKNKQPAVFTIHAHSNLAYEPDVKETSSDANGTAHSDITSSPLSNRKPSEPPSPPPTLKKSINLFHCIAILVAVTGNSSIFISPGAIIGSAGSIGAALVVWLVGGLINMGLALCYTELATMFPCAGGQYAYVLNVLGPLPGFLMLYGYVIFVVGPSWAFLAYTSALYIMKPLFPDCATENVELGIKLLAGWILVTVVVLNCTFMRFVTKVQTFLSMTKVLALLIIISGGIAMLVQGKTDNFENLFADTSKEPGELAISVFYTSFAYGGWQTIMTLAEEVKDPGRDLPISVYMGFIIIIMKYILANAAYFTLINPVEMLQSNAVASLFCQRLYSPISILISVLVATTSIAALNAVVMGNSRVLFAGARVGHVPLIFGMIHSKYLTPWPANFVLLAWGLTMLFTGGLTTMMVYIGFFATIAGIAVVVSLLYLRVKRPGVNRPYKTMLCVPIVQLIVNVAVLVMAVYQRPHQMGIALAILVAGIPVYWFGVLWKNKPKELTKIVEGLTILAQKILVVVKASQNGKSLGKTPISPKK
ncbi:cystine/glutamate transporter-like [Haliotis cracherodii]|uniref:cystine/glutamate transporter-like n=1 Tax=Haliotis cracherodii TaxID=6455 RepID=UPI0039ED0AD4